MGYRLCHRIAQDNLLLGNTVIADSVNPWNLTRQEWNNVANEIGASFINIEVTCTDKIEHQKRIETRVQSIPGLKNPVWKDVLERDYHPWTEERIQLETNNKTIDEAFHEMLAHLNKASGSKVI
ncbi:MAG: ATP-binding protein [Bacteriovoracia bacterium]